MRNKEDRELFIKELGEVHDEALNSEVISLWVCLTAMYMITALQWAAKASGEHCKQQIALCRDIVKKLPAKAPITPKLMQTFATLMAVVWVSTAPDGKEKVDKKQVLDKLREGIAQTIRYPFYSTEED